jgi:hypothetical protein
VNWLKEHPLGAVLIGMAIGVMFGTQLKRLPGVSKLPTG